MRKLILLLPNFIVATFALAQPKVGIGTSLPKWALHVHTPTSPFSYINFTNSTTTDAAYRGLLLGMQDGANYLFSYENYPTYFGTNGSIKMTLSAAGNVGIGTTSPAYLLDVANRMRIGGDSYNTPGIWFNDYRNSTESAFFGMQDSIRIGLYGAGSGGVGWGMNFNAKTGKVNIGNYDGSYRFNVSGSDLGIALYGASNNFYGSMINNNGDLDIEANYGSFFNGVSTPSHNILLNPPASFFTFYPGNVGVNVLSPTARFHVNGNVMVGAGNPATGYQLSVKGKIICEEAKVQLNASWPDYVFASTYKKQTLKQVSNFIKENKHLPNIPSAAEVEKDGLNLGDMQKRLMEKVEELTLYMIDLKRENDQLKWRINKLEKKQTHSSAIKG